MARHDAVVDRELNIGDRAKPVVMVALAMLYEIASLGSQKLDELRGEALHLMRIGGALRP